MRVRRLDFIQAVRCYGWKGSLKGADNAIPSCRRSGLKTFGKTERVTAPTSVAVARTQCGASGSVLAETPPEGPNRLQADLGSASRGRQLHAARCWRSRNAKPTNIAPKTIE